MIVTVNEPVAVLFAASVAVHVTVVVPTGKVLPDAGTQATTGAAVTLPIGESGTCYLFFKTDAMGYRFEEDGTKVRVYRSNGEQARRLQVAQPQSSRRARWDQATVTTSSCPSRGSRSNQAFGAG